VCCAPLESWDVVEERQRAAGCMDGRAVANGPAQVQCRSCNVCPITKTRKLAVTTDENKKVVTGAHTFLF
jgi:hypothetical protein